MTEGAAEAATTFMESATSINFLNQYSVKSQPVTTKIKVEGRWTKIILDLEAEVSCANTEFIKAIILN